MCQVHDTSERVWRHLNFFEYETYLYARVLRTSCQGHGIRLVDLPWARPNSGFTLHIEAMVLAMSDEMSVAGEAATSISMRITSGEYSRHYVNEARKNINLGSVDCYVIDEFAVRKEHRYVTFFYDSRGKRIIHIAEGAG